MNGNNQLVRNLLIRQPLGDQPQHLPLPNREGINELRVRVRLRVSLGGLQHAGNQTPGRRGGQQRIPVRHRPHRPGELLRLRPLTDKPAGPSPQRRHNIRVILKRGENQHPGGGQIRVTTNFFRGRNAIKLGHANIHEHHIGLEALRHGDGIQPGIALAHDSDVVGGVKHDGNGLPDERLIVDE